MAAEPLARRPALVKPREPALVQAQERKAPVELERAQVLEAARAQPGSWAGPVEAGQEEPAAPQSGRCW